jgi:hypothetical protein
MKPGQTNDRWMATYPGGSYLISGLPEVLHVLGEGRLMK